MHPILFLFLGGFIIGRAIERWGLHWRIALGIVGVAGDRPAHLVGAVMLATAFLSLWISNTTSAILMLPIAVSLAAARPEGDRFATAMLLGVAYAATIGGMGSLIGTPPNALFAAYVSETYGLRVGFAQWAMLGLPVASLLLAVAWLVLTRLTPGTGDAPPSMAGLPRPGPWTSAQRRVAVLAGLTAFAWLVRPFAERILPAIDNADAWIGMVAGDLLFVLPSGTGERLLHPRAVASLRLDILILFGGGLALAGMIDRSGLAAWIGSQVAALDALPVWLLVFVLAATIVHVGELASNTAMAAVFLPVAGAAALAVEVDPVAFLLPIALAASVGFMLPVATPPNAIVMDNPAASRQAMLKAGALLDVARLVIAVGVSGIVAGLIF